VVDGGTAAAWPPAAVATVVAASLALVGTAAGTVWAVLRWRRDGERDRRSDRWERTLWVVEMSCSADERRVRIGHAAAKAMYEMQEGGRGRDPLAILILESIPDGGPDGVRGE
jgi:hypothetical protein